MKIRKHRKCSSLIYFATKYSPKDQMLKYINGIRIISYIEIYCITYRVELSVTLILVIVWWISRQLKTGTCKNYFTETKPQLIVHVARWIRETLMLLGRRRSVVHRCIAQTSKLTNIVLVAVRTCYNVTMSIEASIISTVVWPRFKSSRQIRVLKTHTHPTSTYIYRNPSAVY